MDTLYIFFLILSGSLTVINIYNLFAKKKLLPDVVDGSIFILGPLLTLLLYALAWQPVNWQVGFTDRGIRFHEPISNIIVILLIAGIALLGYILLRIKKTSLPPLIIVLCMAAMYLGSVLSVFWILQLLPNINEAYATFPFEGYLMCLFPLNFIISTIALTLLIIKEAAILHNKKEYNNRFLKWCSRVLSKSITYPIISIIIMFPLLGIIIIILILFGQKSDSVITVFTETSDWLFSQKDTPLIVEYGYEYLCTAAARGHTSLVKPLRKGVRGGRLIIVNRQLCVANAFEELIQQKTPRFHKLLRRTYDAIGCPLAKRIKTRLAADIAYIVIKPLEWFLVIVLYLVEARPEDRIARQYLPTNIEF